MRILCIDDEPLMLKMLEKAIKKARPDADVTAHKKQSELLEDAEKNGCDIAFLDIHMYGMNGVELAKKLKPDLCIFDVKMPEMDGIAAAKILSKEKIAPVVLLTAFSQPEFVKRATEAATASLSLSALRLIAASASRSSAASSPLLTRLSSHSPYGT